VSFLHNTSSKSTKLDIAIIGGGSAGITLAAKLSKFSAVVVEPKTPTERDCSWALWANSAQKTQFKAAIKGSWQQWRVIDHHTEVLHSSEQFHYISLSAAEYMAQCESELVEGVDLIRAAAENICTEGIGGSFNAAGQQYKAKRIYDSRPPKMSKDSLKQHFLGWDIRTKSPITNPQIATLMDFRVDQSRGLHFIYVLPFSDRRLLIESTMISKNLEDKEWYRQAIHQWLEKQDIEIEEKLGEETGVIPMQSLNPLAIKSGAIGAASGAVRLSSGYAFSSIQAQISELAEGISRGDFSVPVPVGPFLNYMDKIFNGVLMAQPELGVTIMVRTAKALDADGFARFMLGSASFIDWAKVILAMPKIPFIKQLFLQ
jgi:lycopene beta-cyclase